MFIYLIRESIKILQDVHGRGELLGAGDVSDINSIYIMCIYIKDRFFTQLP